MDEELNMWKKILWGTNEYQNSAAVALLKLACPYFKPKVPLYWLLFVDDYSCENVRSTSLLKVHADFSALPGSDMRNIDIPGITRLENSYQEK